MTDPTSPSTPSPAADGPEGARAEAARIRQSGVLGAQGRLLELFDYLAARMDDERSPKEAEIAHAVFGKSGAEASRDDAAVRVYIHRLRKRLEDYYLRSPALPDQRLIIPKGEYRLVAASSAVSTAEPASPAEEAVAPPASARRRRAGPWLLAAAASLMLVAGAAGGWLASAAMSRDTVADTRIWRNIAGPDRPLLVVLGDYYMFGEYEDRLFLKRLIRDFSINSKDDLLREYLNQPGMSDRYGHVALTYLPTSSGYALAELSPLLRQAGRREVVLASELTPDRFKGADILYVGLISGMGPLKDAVFSNSRFSIGESYDDILDEVSGKTYRSEAFLAAPSDSMYRDYAYMASFTGPAGNRISVLAGARDTGLLGLAELLSREDGVKALAASSGNTKDFEALLEVRGQKHVNLETRVLAAAPVDSARIWQGERLAPRVYPSE
jgi:hypothetical protein